jgi:hypothetical protein
MNRYYWPIALVILFSVIIVATIMYRPTGGPSIRHFSQDEQNRMFQDAFAIPQQKNAYKAYMLGPDDPIRNGLPFGAWIWIAMTPVDASTAVFAFLEEATGMNLTGSQALVLFDGIALASFPAGFDPATGTWGNTNTSLAITRGGVYREAVGTNVMFFDATGFDEAAMAAYPALNIYHVSA